MPFFSRSRNRSRNKLPSNEDVAAEERCGLFVLHDVEQDSNASGRMVDIVAVHGLGGHWKSTWTNTSSHSSHLWLRDFLPKQLRDAGVSARVMSYGYNSDIAFSKAITNIDDEADMLLDRLNGNRESEEEMSRPVLFIAHSLGGIVVKKAIIRAHERSRIYGLLLQNIRATIFLGVPHRGSDSAYWATFLAVLLHHGQLGLGTNTSFVNDLQRNSETFGNISRQFVERAIQLHIRTFFETEKMGNQLIVDKDSATLGLPNEIAVGIAGSNHRTMCKFDSAGSQKYFPVWKAVKALANSALDSQHHQNQPPTRQPDQSLLQVKAQENTLSNGASAISPRLRTPSPSRGEARFAESPQPQLRAPSFSRDGFPATHALEDPLLGRPSPPLSVHSTLCDEPLSTQSSATDLSKSLCDALSAGNMGDIFEHQKSGLLATALLAQVAESSTSGYLKQWLDGWGVVSGRFRRKMTALHYAVEITGPFASYALEQIIEEISRTGSSKLDVRGSAPMADMIDMWNRACQRGMHGYGADSLHNSIPLHYTPLAWAAILDNYDAVDQLIKAGADVNLRDSTDGHTALTAQSLISPLQSLRSTSLLLQGGARQDLFTQGPKALRNALRFKKWGLAKDLILAGSPVNACDPSDPKRQTPLHMCTFGATDPNALEIWSILVSMGARTDTEDAFGKTPTALFYDFTGESAP